MTQAFPSHPPLSTKSQTALHIGHEGRLDRQSKRKLGVGRIENDWDMKMTALDEFGSYWTALRNCVRRASGSPGDHASPRFPPEPPSLARPTPQGRAMAAEGASASLWWARASAVLERVAPWLFEKVPDDELRARMAEQWSRRPHEARMHRGAGQLNERMLLEAACQNSTNTSCRCGDAHHRTRHRCREYDPCVTATPSIFPRR